MIVMLSGKITGYPYYKQDFDKSEQELNAQGHIVLNPTIFPLGLTYEDYLELTLSMVRVCDAIYMLDGYSLSTGAMMELNLAKELGKEVWYEEAEGEAEPG